MVIIVLQEILVIEHFQLKKMVKKYVLYRKKPFYDFIQLLVFFSFQVAEIHKKRFHLHDTYSVDIIANQDPAVILLLTIGIDEIRQH